VRGAETVVQNSIKNLRPCFLSEGLTETAATVKAARIAHDLNRAGCAVFSWLELLKLIAASVTLGLLLGSALGWWLL
jgi:hypothetical protein